MVIVHLNATQWEVLLSTLFEEIDYRATPIGAISLRRRRILALDQDVYEIILGDEHLMSSLFNASEIALAKLGLEAHGCLLYTSPSPRDS